MENEKDRNNQQQAGTAEASANAVKRETAQAPGASESGLPADLADAYRKLLAEKNELYDRLLRKQAELENSRKRLQREKDEFLQHATADLIRALLPVLDGFERALKQRNRGVPGDFYEGIELIYRNMLDVLSRAGLVPIETTGAMFDPYLHQAVEGVESPEHRDQEIVEELQRGYKLRHRLLRPAVVRVAVAPRKQPSKAPGGDSGRRSETGATEAD